MLKMGFTGTRRGMTEIQAKRVWLLFRQADEIHLGDCIGADEEAHRIARSMKKRLVGHPPVDTSKRAFLFYNMEFEPEPYLERDTAIVMHTDILVACPRFTVEELRNGTWATVRRARKAKKRIAIVYPNGVVEQEG